MDGARVVAAGGTSSARRRRERRLRSMLRHERMAVAMALAEALHHSSGLKVMERAQHAALRGQETGTRAGVAGPAPVTEYVAPAPAVAPFSAPVVSFKAPAPMVGYVAPTPAVTYAAPAPVVGYVAPALAVTYAAPAPVVGFVSPAPSVTYPAPAPVIGYVAPTPSVTFATPASVFEYVAPAPVLEYIAPTPAVSYVAPSQQLRPAYSAEGSASQVVGSLPHGEVFAAPVFNQVHQEQLAGEIPENLVENPVVQKQVIVQASPHVVGSLPPVAEFTSPMYNPVHQEQFSAGDTAENFAIFPVVQEQVLVGMRPERVRSGAAGGGSSVRLPRVPWCPLSRCRRWVTMLVTTLPRLSSCSGAPWLRERGRGWRRQRLSFSRIAPASIVQWRINGSWRVTATPSSSTTVSLACRVSFSPLGTLTTPYAVTLLMMLHTVY